MDRKAEWRSFFAESEMALRQGESIAASCFGEPPVDVFQILREERRLIRAVGRDFGDSFDGRIRYLGDRFLLCYNTTYNKRFRKNGKNHSKVLFTIAHELGHYFLDHHREALVHNRRPHKSFTEFTSKDLVEREADHFAAGLLMPSSLLKPRINFENFPSIDSLLSLRSEFNVSLTGFLVRWVQASDFPCAVVATYNGQIRFGWTSPAFHKIHCYSVYKGYAASSSDFVAFLNSNSPVSRYAQATGHGETGDWLNYESKSFDTSEFYFAIPHTGYVWAFLMCDERDFVDDRFD